MLIAYDLLSIPLCEVGETEKNTKVEKPEGRTEEAGTRKAAYVVPVDENRYKSQEWLSDKC